MDTLHFILIGQNLLVILAMGLPLLLVCGAVASYWLLNRRTNTWRHFARRHGFYFEPTNRESGTVGHPVVSGQVDGRPFRLYAADSGSDNDLLGAAEVVMSLGVRGTLPEMLSVTQADGIVGVARRHLDTEASIPTFSDFFDRQVVVHGSSATDVQHYLNAERRAALIEFLAAGRLEFAGLSEGVIFIHDREMLTNIDRLDEWLRLLRRIAPSLDADALTSPDIGERRAEPTALDD